MPPVALIIIYVALALAPLALVAGFSEDITASLRMLAIGCGLVAFAMLLMQFISSGRIEHICRKVGINRTMRFHQISTRLLLLLVILHPLLFFIPDSLSELPQKAGMLARILVSNYMLSGTIALFVFLFIVATSVWRHKLPVKYELWRASHVLGVTVIAVAGAHHVFSVGFYSREYWLRAFWWVMLVVAVGALGYTYLIKPWFLARSRYRVQSVRELGQRIWEVTLDPVNLALAKSRALSFTAGQFAWVNFRAGAIPIFDNPFSISSSPAELPSIRLLIKARGDGTSRIGELATGTTVYLDAPHGNFTLTGRKGDALYLIAGGIGIAPIISILRDLAAKGDKRPISLLFGAENLKQLIYADEIRALQNELDLKVFFSVHEPPADWKGGVGDIDANTIRRNLPAAARRCLCFVCGPTPMMLAVERHLLATGVPSANIVYERFEYD